MHRSFQAIILLSLLLAAGDAPGMGLGVYSSFGTGRYLWTSETLKRSREKVPGAGLAFDSNPFGENLFSYRLSLGWEKSLAEVNRYKRTFRYDMPYTQQMIGANFTRIPLEYNRFHLTSHFGFGIARGPNIRFWLGPDVILAREYARFKYHQYQQRSPLGSPTVTPILRPNADKQYDLYGFGAGISLGLNLRIGEFLGLALQGGMRAMYFFGDREYLPSVEHKEKGDISSSGYSWYVSAGVMALFSGADSR